LKAGTSFLKRVSALLEGFSELVSDFVEASRNFSIFSPRKEGTGTAAKKCENH
jgi:hypothetical protein